MKTFREIAEMHYSSESENDLDKQHIENRINSLEKLLTQQLALLRVGCCCKPEQEKNYTFDGENICMTFDGEVFKIYKNNKLVSAEIPSETGFTIYNK